jgi:hypothetical protein
VIEKDIFECNGIWGMIVNVYIYTLLKNNCNNILTKIVFYSI